MKILSSRFHERPMAYAAIGAVLAAVGGSVVPHWFAYAACAASLPLVVFLFHRRNTAFLLPVALMLVLVRMLLLPTAIPADSGVGLFLRNLRTGMLNAADALFRDEAAAAKGMLLGNTDFLNDVQRAQFANAGLLHLFAVSGLHVSLLVDVLGRIAHTRNKAVSYTALALFLLFFCAVTGFSASVLRASFMLLGLRVAKMRERQNDPPNAYCFAMAMTLLCDPGSVFRAGFQLSFAAAAGLLLLAKPFRAPFNNRLPNSKIITALTASTAAIIGMLPITAYWFGQVAWIAIPLSILLIPTMPIILLFGFFAILLYGIFPHVAVVLSYPAYGAIKFLSLVTASLNVPLLSLPKPHPIAIVLYYVGLLFSSELYLKNAKRPPWIGLGLLAVSIVLWFLL